VAALLSLLINKHGQMGIVILTSVDLIQVVLKDVKNQMRPKWVRKNLPAKSGNIQVTILQWHWSPTETFLFNL